MAVGNYPKAGFHPAGQDFSLKIDSENLLSYGDLASILRDIESILALSSKEVSARTRLTQGKRGHASLVIKEFHTGSLELLSDPYLTSVSAGVVGNAVFAVFLYVMRRVNGRPSSQNSDLEPVNTDLISNEKMKAAASKAVELSTNQRRRLREKKQTYGLSITITTRTASYDVTED